MSDGAGRGLRGLAGLAGGAKGRAARRRAWFGLLTVLGLAERGFFIPCRTAGEAPPPGRRPPYAAIEERLAAREERFREILELCAGYAPDLLRIGEARPPEPRWTQDWFPRLDAAVAYSLLRELAPARVVEVGSGHSTRFLRRAVADGGLATRITAIDPAPRADIGAAGNGNGATDVTLLRCSVQAAGEAPFRDLAAGDLLMIDSSHVLMPGSDVDFLFGRVLPRLPAGVRVQVHDIFLPDDYPADWHWRGYNEQLGVAALLLGGGWEVVFASHYVASRMTMDLAASPLARLPLPPGSHESSLWLVKR